VDYRLHETDIRGMADSAIPDIGSIFGGVLQRHRGKAGVSQEELAFRAGLDRTFVSRLERGIRQPTITTLISLAEALGISATDLVRETESEYSRAKPRRTHR